MTALARPHRPKKSVYPYLLGLATPLVVEPVMRTPYLTISNWLRDFWSWPEERRRAYQQACLHAVLDHARRRVPFYRDLLAGKPPELPLTDLPVVDKARMRADMDAFRSEGWAQMPYMDKQTGGTTYGDPWQYPLDKQAWAHTYGAALHFYERTGYRYGERIVLLGSPTSLGHGRRSLKAWVRNAIERRVVSIAGTDVGHAASLDRAHRAAGARAALWYGYAGTIAAMADAVLAEGIRLAGPQAVVTTAEALRPEWRRRIGEAFGSAVFDQYGCNDGGIISQTCERGRFHVAENLSIVEVLDERRRPCPPHVEGEVVVTNLHARVLPFLRYRVGDRAVPGEGPCPCGHPGLTLERMVGRQSERIKLPDGRRLSGVPLGFAFEHTKTIRRWQIVQPDLRSLKVRLDVYPGQDAVEQRRVLRELDEMCGHQLDITLTTDEPIESSSGGKHRLVLQYVD